VFKISYSIQLIRNYKHIKISVDIMLLSSQSTPSFSSARRDARHIGREVSLFEKMLECQLRGLGVSDYSGVLFSNCCSWQQNF
jgi:hypothetical protein